MTESCPCWGSGKTRSKMKAIATCSITTAILDSCSGPGTARPDMTRWRQGCTIAAFASKTAPPLTGSRSDLPASGSDSPRLSSIRNTLRIITRFSSMTRMGSGWRSRTIVRNGGGASRIGTRRERPRCQGDLLRFRFLQSGDSPRQLASQPGNTENNQNHPEDRGGGLIERDVFDHDGRPGQGGQDDKSPIKKRQHQQRAENSADEKRDPGPGIVFQFEGDRVENVSSGEEPGDARRDALQENGKQRADQPRSRRH